jgi:hypothetical protein
MNAICAEHPCLSKARAQLPLSIAMKKIADQHAA